MRKIGIILLFVTASAWAYESAGLPNMITPSELTAGQAEFILDHRFRGLVNDKPIENLFGMHAGANVSLGFRSSLGKGFDLTISHVFDPRESGLDIGYSFGILSLPLRAKVDGKVFSFRRVIWEETRETAFQFGLALQSKPIADRISPVLNVLYDSYKNPDKTIQPVRIAAGCDLMIVQKFHVFGEYYYKADTDAIKNVYVFGLKVLTWGHQFYFLLGNEISMGNRWLNQGAYSNDLHFGFAIHRLIEF